MPQFPCTSRSRFCLLRSNGRLNLKRSHSLDNTCSHLTPKLVTKNAGNSHSWELNFQKFSRGAFPQTAMADRIGGRGLGVCAPPPSPILNFFFTKTKFTSKKLVFSEYEICLKMLKMAILEPSRRSFCTFHLKVLDLASGPTRNITRPAILQPGQLCY